MLIHRPATRASGSPVILAPKAETLLSLAWLANLRYAGGIQNLLYRLEQDGHSSFNAIMTQLGSLAASAPADKNAWKIVERHCRKGRYGAATRYAQSVAGTPELMALINRRLDSKLRLFLALSTPKTALRRLRRGARKRGAS